MLYMAFLDFIHFVKFIQTNDKSKNEEEFFSGINC